MRGMEVFMPQPAYLDELAMGYADFKISAAMLGPRSSAQDLARTSQVSNVLTEQLLDDIAAFREKIYDSEHLKKNYSQIHFDEIIYPNKLGHNTIETITDKRQQRHRFPWHERSLIVSALTLRLLRTLDEKAAYYLLDFVRDREPQVWKKALTGLVMAYVQHEQKPTFIPPEHLRRDLAILREDPDVAQALLEITEHLARPETEQEAWDKHIGKVKFDDKFEFFQQVPHWFLPFYPDNPVLREHIADPELRDLLLQTNEWRPDALKYAFCLHYRQLSLEERKSTLDELRQSRADERRYHFIRHLYPGFDKAEALRRSREVPDCIRQIRFFLRYFSDDRFRDVVLEKVPLYNSSLGQLLLSDQSQIRQQAMWFYVQGKEEEALLYFLQIPHADSDALFFHSKQAEILKKLKRYDEAIDCLEDLLVKYPKDTGLLRETRDCYILKSSFNQTLFYSQRLLDLEPENVENWSCAGMVLCNLRRYEESLEYLKQAEVMAPHLLENLRNLASCYCQKGDYEQELPYRQRVVELESEEVENWAYLGVALGLLKRYEEAIEQHEKAEALNPNLPWNLRCLAWCYRQKEDYEQELHYRQRVAELEPENAANWTDIGAALFFLKCYDEAIEQCKKAEELDPKMLWNLKVLAILYREKKDYEQELPYRQRVAELQPENAENLGMVGAAFRDLKRYDKAIKQHKKAETLDPNLVWNLKGLAWCYREKEDYEQESPYRQRVAELEPENAENWFELAKSQFKLQHRDEAIGSIEKAIALAPDDASTSHLAGWACFVSGCIPEAKQHFLRCIELNYGKDHAPMNLGHISLIEQNEPEALAYYQRSFELTEDVPKLLEGFEDDYKYLKPHGIQHDYYWRVVRQAQAAAGV